MQGLARSSGQYATSDDLVAAARQAFSCHSALGEPDRAFPLVDAAVAMAEQALEPYALPTRTVVVARAAKPPLPAIRGLSRFTGSIPPGRHGPALPQGQYGNAVSRMKTSIEIPDELFTAAKKRAAELRQPLRTLIEWSLRAELARGSTGGSRPTPVRLTWVTVEGGLPAGIDPADRPTMHERLARRR
ncbi:MAG: hypothetical protein ACKO9B_07730 [Planctomycetota bacterium]